jgi:hypothetical protein
LAVSLYNFDFDDAQVEPEHRTWLDENVLRYHRVVPGLRLFLRGTASRVGAASYNRTLSEHRVESVRAYLVRQGFPPGDIDLTWTGADLSTSQSNDDEADRAVFVLVTAPPMTNVRFERAAFWNKCDGFDDDSSGLYQDAATRCRIARQRARAGGGVSGLSAIDTPFFVGGPGVIVPLEKGPKPVRLVGGRGTTVESLQKDKADVRIPASPGTPVVSQDPAVIELIPHAPGDALIIARSIHETG